MNEQSEVIVDMSEDIDMITEANCKLERELDNTYDRRIRGWIKKVMEKFKK